VSSCRVVVGARFSRPSLRCSDWIPALAVFVGCFMFQQHAFGQVLSFPEVVDQRLDMPDVDFLESFTSTFRVRTPFIPVLIVFSRVSHLCHMSQPLSVMKLNNLTELNWTELSWTQLICRVKWIRHLMPLAHSNYLIKYQEHTISVNIQVTYV